MINNILTLKNTKFHRKINKIQKSIVKKRFWIKFENKTIKILNFVK
jgi:hypothetical protein